MKRITRTVTLDDLRDLIEAPENAYLAYAAGDEAEAARVIARRDGERWLVTLPAGVSMPDGARVVLLIDDGEFYFELRGARVRGTLREAGVGEHEIVAERVVTWDYGAMRERTS